MHMKRIWMLLALLALLAWVPACGKKDDEQAEQAVTLRAAELSGDPVLVTVDGRPLTGEAVLYWLADACDGIADYYESANAPLRWDALLEGETLAEYAKEQAVQNAALYATVETWAEENGCILTEEDEAALKADWAQRVKEAGGEEAYADHLLQEGLSRTGAERLAGDHYLYLHLCALASAAESKLAPTEVELTEFFTQQAYFTFRMLEVPKDAAAPEVGRQKAADLFARLNASADPVAAFSTLAAETGGAGPQTAKSGDGTLSETLEQAVQSLKPGQLSGVVDATERYVILLRLPPETEAVRDDWFDGKLQAAAENAKVERTEAFEELSVERFYANLETCRTQATADN